MNTNSFLAIGLAVTVLSAVPQSQGANDLVAAAERAADAGAATPEGKKFEEVVGTSFGRDHGKSIQACAKEVGRPDLSDFRLLMYLSTVGQVEQVLAKPDTNLAACVRGKLKAWKIGPTPKAAGWVGVDVKLKAK
jgi:hypothetical protein